MRTRVILNPTAGAGRAARRIHELTQHLNTLHTDLEWTLSNSAEHVTTLCAEAADRNDRAIFVAGGDGTIHFAARGLRGSNTALGILPLGTGNDIATSVGIEQNVYTLAHAFQHGYTTPMDLGVTSTGDTFACVLGVGMDTPALKRVHRSSIRKGKLLYNLAALRTLCTYRPRNVRITCDAFVFEGRAFLTAITNTPTYAGGLTLCPDASTSDGLLDICVVPDMSFPHLLTTFHRIRRGTHARSRAVLLAQTTQVSIESDTPLPVTLDGELTELQTPLQVRVQPGALQVLSPHVGSTRRKAA